MKDLAKQPVYWNGSEKVCGECRGKGFVRTLANTPKQVCILAEHLPDDKIETTYKQCSWCKGTGAYFAQPRKEPKRCTAHSEI